MLRLSKRHAGVSIHDTPSLLLSLIGSDPTSETLIPRSSRSSPTWKVVLQDVVETARADLEMRRFSSPPVVGDSDGFQHLLRNLSLNISQTLSISMSLAPLAGRYFLIFPNVDWQCHATSAEPPSLENTPSGIGTTSLSTFSCPDYWPCCTRPLKV